MTRIEREKQTVGLMIRLYCRKNHTVVGGELCPDCAALFDYAKMRLALCPHGEKKPSCRKCTIHCYSPLNKKKIRAVMRATGPIMILHHPLPAIRHLYYEFIK